MTAKLYVVPGSHPSMAGRLMLEHKGIAYDRIDLRPCTSHREAAHPGGDIPKALPQA